VNFGYRPLSCADTGGRDRVTDDGTYASFAFSTFRCCRRPPAQTSVPESSTVAINAISTIRMRSSSLNGLPGPAKSRGTPNQFHYARGNRAKGESPEISPRTTPGSGPVSGTPGGGDRKMWGRVNSSLRDGECARRGVAVRGLETHGYSHSVATPRIHFAAQPVRHRMVQSRANIHHPTLTLSPPHPLIRIFPPAQSSLHGSNSPGRATTRRGSVSRRGCPPG